MTPRELVSSLVAFTVIVAIIDTVVAIEWARDGFSLFRVGILAFTTVCLASVYRSYLGELLRRRRAHQTRPLDKNGG